MEEGVAIISSKLAEEHGAEVVKRGLPRPRAARTASDPVIVAADVPATDETMASNGVLDRASVRAAKEG